MTVYAGKVNTAAVALTDMYSRPDGLSVYFKVAPHSKSNKSPCLLQFKEGCTGDSGSHSAVVHTLLQQFLICVTFGNFSERYF